MLSTVGKIIAKIIPERMKDDKEQTGFRSGSRLLYHFICFYSISSKLSTTVNTFGVLCAKNGILKKLVVVIAIDVLQGSGQMTLDLKN